MEIRITHEYCSWYSRHKLCIITESFLNNIRLKKKKKNYIIIVVRNVAQRPGNFIVKKQVFFLVSFYTYF